MLGSRQEVGGHGRGRVPDAIQRWTATRPVARVVSRLKGETSAQAAGRRHGSDRRLAALVALVLFAYYLLILGGHQYSIDGILIFQSAKRLLFHGSFVLDPPVRWGNDVTISRFSVGMTLAYLPGLALSWPLLAWYPGLKEVPYDPSVAYNPRLYANLPYALCSWLNPLLTALTGYIVFRLARLLGLSRGWAVAVALAYGVASPAAAYARYDFAQPLAGLALALAVLWLLESGAALSPRLLLRAGAGLGVAVLTRPELILLVPWIVGWLAAWARARGVRAVLARAVALLGPVAAGSLLYLASNWIKFGSAVRTGYGAGIAPVSPERALEGLAGLLASPEHGLLIFFPLAWLSIPGVSRLIREDRRAASLIAGLLGISVLMYSFFETWWAGWSWGPRFLVPVLPLAALASAAWTAGPARGRSSRLALFSTLAVLGFVASLTGILTDFVVFTSWVERTSAAAGPPHFRPAASPLVSGWRFLSMAPLDLLWVRMWRTGQPGFVLAAAGIVTLLLGTIAGAAMRCRRLLLADAARPGRAGGRAA